MDTGAVKGEIEIHATKTPKPRPADTGLGFGRHFTDHMFMMDWATGQGWHAPRIVPYGPLNMDPAAGALHYGQAMFEGMKAFRGRDGQVRLFRVERHCQRMSRGAPRLCMPSVDADFMQRAITALVSLDAAWVPAAVGTSLYLRPTMVATEPYLGVRPSSRYTFFVIASPVGSYYAEGMSPVKIWVEQRYVRAPHGGLGGVKAGANYAASLLAADRARHEGYSQVLWLDGEEHRFLQEVGTMNVFVRIGDELLTPPLDDSILAGVTRDCVLALARHWGLAAREARLTVDELRAAHRAGTLREVFGSGTAAVIAPVGEIGLGEERLVVGGGGIGEWTRRFYDAITAVQYAHADDTHGWLTPVS